MYSLMLFVDTYTLIEVSHEDFCTGLCTRDDAQYLVNM